MHSDRAEASHSDGPNAMNRRKFCASVCAGGVAAALAGCAGRPRLPIAAKVVVIGGGCGGATAAKYLRLWSNHSVDVLLIEPNAEFVSSPLSNRVIDGELQLGQLTSSYESLRRRHGVRIVQDRATSIDPDKRVVTLAGGGTVHYDELVLSPGIDSMFETVDGLAQAHADGRILQSWSAGPDTVALRAQLAAMRDGGVFVITVPESPYRCPPAPYERATLVAAFFQQYKAKSKVLVLDANQDVTAMGALFKRAWSELYAGTLEYRNHYRVTAVDAKSLTARFEVQEDVRADVLNVLPSVRAGALACDSGLANINARWCEVNFASFESTVAKHVYILGDAVQAAPMMPKSGHMANGHAKVAAAAILAALQGRPVDPEPVLTNTCYSFMSPTEAVHAAAVYQYDVMLSTFKPVAGTSGASATRSPLEASYAMGWARNLWADMLG